MNWFSLAYCEQLGFQTLVPQTICNYELISIGFKGFLYHVEQGQSFPLQFGLVFAYNFKLLARILSILCRTMHS